MVFPKEVTESILKLTEYLANNHHPHTRIIIENGKVEVVESVLGFRCWVEPTEFLADTDN